MYVVTNLWYLVKSSLRCFCSQEKPHAAQGSHHQENEQQDSQHYLLESVSISIGLFVLSSTATEDDSPNECDKGQDEAEDNADQDGDVGHHDRLHIVHHLIQKVAAY